jgi:hypothetical protein
MHVAPKQEPQNVKGTENMNDFLKSIVLVAIFGCIGSANAATFNYTFQDNVTDPGFSINHIDTIATERLSSPFATLTVSDEEGGVRFTYASLGVLDGKVSGIAFKYQPAFQQGLEQVWPNAQPSNGGAYFFTDSDTAIPYLFVAGYGVEYSSEDQILAPLMGGPLNIMTIKDGAVPASFVFNLDTTTTRSDSFTLHLRGLSSDVTAASLAPQYVRAIGTSYGKMPDGGGMFGQLPVVGQAVILASPVPESSTTAQMLLGMLSAAVVFANRRPSRPQA